MKPTSFLLPFLLLAGGFILINGQKSVRLAQKAIMAELFSEANYDKRVRPAGLNEGSGSGGSGKPVQVQINLYIRNIEQLNDNAGEWTLQLTYRSSWRDDRLTFNSQNGRIAYLPLKDTSRLWTPSTFFANEKRSHFHAMPSPNSLVRVHPSGEVLFTTRLTLTLQCRMALADFPADRQKCHIQLASYAHPLQHVEYAWTDDRPIQVDTAALNIPHFRLEAYQTEVCNASVTNTGTYSCLKASFTFRRQAGHYLLTAYLPLALLVLVSWTAFWLSPRSAGSSRTLVTLASLLAALALIAYSSSSSNQLGPHLSRLDIYTGVVVTFLLGALLQSAAVNFLLGAGHDEESSCRWFAAVRLDRISRAAFPLAFLLFAIVYSCATFTLGGDSGGGSGEDSLFIVRKSSGL